MPPAPTFSMLVGGRLRRADAGRGHALRDGTGTVVGFATVASRADVTAAVAAARVALPGWSGLSAHERGRVLHAVAEVLDERRDRLAADLAGEADDVDGTPVADAGAPDTAHAAAPTDPTDPVAPTDPAAPTAPTDRAARTDPAEDVGAAVDRWLWYAGWTDKLAGLRGGVHPVAGAYASWSAPRPVGVVGVLAPGSLPGLVDGLAAALTCGATAAVVAPLRLSRAVATIAEVLATAELPAGAANLLTGDVAERAPELARAVDGLDLAGLPPGRAAELAQDAAGGARVVPARVADPLARLRAWSDVTTVWHSVGR